jgi:hypothetical protein
MNAQTFWEIVGYAAMVLVTVSLMMRSIVRLRWINLAGGILFAIYGIMIAAYPVAVLNLAVVAINIYHLWKMRRRVHESFAVAHMPPDSEYVLQFMDFHRRDIDRTQPGATVNADARVVFVLRDTVPAGVLALGAPDDTGAGRVTLDFATPAYRDLKVGTYLFRTSGELQRMGYRRLLADAGTPDHERYLSAMGFRHTTDGYALELAGIPT